MATVDRTPEQRARITKRCAKLQKGLAKCVAKPGGSAGTCFLQRCTVTECVAQALAATGVPSCKPAQLALETCRRSVMGMGSFEGRKHCDPEMAAAAACGATPE